MREKVRSLGYLKTALCPTSYTGFSNLGCLLTSSYAAMSTIRKPKKQTACFMFVTVYPC